MNIIVARRLPDGNLVEVLPDGSTRPLPATTNWAEVDLLSDDEITARAIADPDAQPVPDGWIERAAKGPHPRAARKRLKLSREDFARRYRIPLETVVAWEEGTREPDDVARAFMKAITGDPEAVARALGSNNIIEPTTPRAAE